MCSQLSFSLSLSLSHCISAFQYALFSCSECVIQKKNMLFSYGVPSVCHGFESCLPVSTRFKLSLGFFVLQSHTIKQNKCIETTPGASTLCSVRVLYCALDSKPYVLAGAAPPAVYFFSRCVHLTFQYQSYSQSYAYHTHSWTISPLRGRFCCIALRSSTPIAEISVPSGFWLPHTNTTHNYNTVVTRFPR